VLFSSRYGFLSWTPVLYLAAVGLLFYARQNPMWSVAALGVLFISAWALGSSDAWPAVAGFGGRPLLSVLSVLAPGLAYLLELMRRRPVLAIAPLVAAPIVWNHLLMVQYTVGLLPKDEPVSFARLVRQQADVHARAFPLYPFAFPANVWFAWREGLPLDRYDVLALEPRAQSVDLVLDRSAERFLLEGWDGPTAEGEGAGWWIGEREATVAVPLTLPRSPVMRVSVTARSRLEEPVMEADLSVLINGREVGQFSPAADRPSESQFTVPGSMFREGFNKVTLASRGAHRVDSSDVRPPGPLARRAGRPAWPVAIYRVAISPYQGQGAGARSQTSGRGVGRLSSEESGISTQ
jgi:hypothetical protein